jgi:hypothetical protein
MAFHPLLTFFSFRKKGRDDVGSPSVELGRYDCPDDDCIICMFDVKSGDFDKYCCRRCYDLISYLVRQQKKKRFKEN